MNCIIKPLIICFYICVVQLAFGQNDKKFRLKVLEKGVINRPFVFGKWTKEGGTQSTLKHLGQFKTNNGEIYKVMNSTWVWGNSHRATSRILIFNSNNKYIGNYNVTVTDALPSKLIDGKLVFINISDDCDKKLTTTIDLKNGLPTKIFRKCKGNDGDIYVFSAD